MPDTMGYSTHAKPNASRGMVCKRGLFSLHYFDEQRTRENLWLVVWDTNMGNYVTVRKATDDDIQKFTEQNLLIEE